MYKSRLRTRLLILSAVLAAAPILSAAAELSAHRLAEQCASRDWNAYMQCQRVLLRVRESGDFCVPTPENGARYQLEFITFYRDSAGLPNEQAKRAAARYFAASYPCA